MMKKLLRSETALVVAAIVILVSILMLKPVIGVADNGDFNRIMTAGGIEYSAEESYQDKYFGYFHQTYSYYAMAWGGYVSSQIPLAILAGLIGRLVNGEYFDIRILGVMHSMLYLAALYVWLRFNKSSSAIGNSIAVVLSAFIFLDIGYIAYFNSFFGEALTLILMLLTFGLALAVAGSDKASWRMLALFYISSILLTATKLQNAPIGIILIAAGLCFWQFSKERAWRRTIVIGTASLLVAAAVMYVAAPKDLKHINLYQTIFYGILKDSPDPDKALKQLGLPMELKALAGTNYFQGDTAIKQDDPILYEHVYNRLGHIDVLVYYLKNPSRFVQKLERAAENGMTIRPYYLGSYDQSEGKKRGAIAYTYSGWSEFKRNVLPNELWFIAALYLLYFAGILYEYSRRKETRHRARTYIFAAVGLIGIFGFTIPLLGDGEADLGKHLFLFNVCFDMMIAIGVVYTAWKLLSFKEPFRKKVKIPA